MLAGEKPYASKGKFSKQRVLDGERPDLEIYAQDWPPGVVELMEACWRREPGSRPGFQFVLQSLNMVEDDFSRSERDSTGSKRKAGRGLSTQRSSEDTTGTLTLTPTTENTNTTLTLGT